MPRQCELCASPKPVKLRRVLVETRIIALCPLHAELVRERAPATVDELRRAFAERRGQRSLLERRATLDRRAFPARPEGRRANAGRRETDPRD